jgi:hypothetical protein
MLEVSHIPDNGSSMLAVFCDLTIEDQKDFLPWLEEDMFPARLNIGFKSCASYNLIEGNGSDFVTLYEVRSLGDLYDSPYQNLRNNRTKRDADYHKKFQNPMRYSLAWVGPEVSKKKIGFGPFIHIERFDVTDNLVEEYNSWFVTTYLPSLLKSSNTISLRRYIAVEGVHRYFVIREFLEHNAIVDNTVLIEYAGYKSYISGVYQRLIRSP